MFSKYSAFASGIARASIQHVNTYRLVDLMHEETDR